MVFGIGCPLIRKSCVIFKLFSERGGGSGVCLVGREKKTGPQERNCLPLCDKINLAIKLVFDGRKTSFGAESLHTQRAQG